MLKRVISFFQRLSLAQRFMLASLLIVASGMAGVAWWVGQQIESGVVDRTAATTALYVDSFIAPQIQELATSDALTPEHAATLDALLHQTDFAKQIVSFKIWSSQGRILYSNNPENVGQTFPVQGGLARAWRGWVAARLSDLTDEENEVERQSQSRLLEIYSPVRLRGSNRVIAVVEFYQTSDALQGEINSAQRQSWALFGVAGLLMYLLLAIFVQRASNTIDRQRDDLVETIDGKPIIVGESGTVEADIECAVVSIRGTVTGRVLAENRGGKTVKGRLTLQVTGVPGSLTTPVELKPGLHAVEATLTVPADAWSMRGGRCMTVS